MPEHGPHPELDKNSANARAAARQAANPELGQTPHNAPEQEASTLPDANEARGIIAGQPESPHKIHEQYELRVGPDDENLKVIDRRAQTPETVLAADAKRQEALNAPLGESELTDTAAILQDSLDAQIADLPPDATEQQINDLERDKAALQRIISLVTGHSMAFAGDFRRAGNTPIEKRLDIVEQNLRPYRAEDDQGNIHVEGYEGSYYYEIARARDYYQAITSDTSGIRRHVLEPAEADRQMPAFLNEPLTAETVDAANQRAGTELAPDQNPAA